MKAIDMSNPLLNPVNKPFLPIQWKGISGSVYEFQLDPIGTIYLPIPGVYIFCRNIGGTSWSAQYVGETEDMNRRLSDQLQAHHSLGAVRLHGSTHISTLRVNGGAAERVRIETDLRHSLNPPCNKQ